jgi:GTP cyclohydrolase II
MIAYAESADEWMPHLALVSEKTPAESQEPVIVRLHSECITGDLFGSQRCDCGEQLDYALQAIAEKGGILLYLRQEGRGIGIINKLKAYQLQDEGLDTVEANVHLGLEIDARQYGIALDMLRDLGVSRIHLLTNNPEKIGAFERSDIEIVDRLPIVVPPRSENESYLRTKRDQMGHLYDLIRTR